MTQHLHHDTGSHRPKKCSIYRRKLSRAKTVFLTFNKAVSERARLLSKQRNTVCDPWLTLHDATPELTGFFSKCITAVQHRINMTHQQRCELFFSKPVKKAQPAQNPLPLLLSDNACSETGDLLACRRVHFDSRIRLEQNRLAPG